MQEIELLVQGCSVCAGVFFNLLLLYLIANYSNKSMSNYRYLLFLFGFFDTFLIFYHAVTETRVIIVDTTIFGFVSNMRWQIKIIPSLYCAFFSVPFSLIIIHYLYRYWAIHSPSKLDLFTKKPFILLIFCFALFQCVTWFLLALIGTGGGPEEIGTIIAREAYRQKFNVSIYDGWVVMDHWVRCVPHFLNESANSQRDGQFSLQLTITIAIVTVLMVSNFSVTLVLSSSTFWYILNANSISSQFRRTHMTYFAAVCAQALVPVFFVYIPYFCSITFPYWRIPTNWLPNGVIMIGCFPAFDALAVILIMKDYRRGLRSMLRMTEMPVSISISKSTSGVVS